MPGPSFDGLLAWENLFLAYQEASRGKRGRPAVAVFEHRLGENLLRLQEELRSGDYRPGSYHSFFVHEPKRRLISAAPFRDRVVHHALCNVIEPSFERGFVPHSYANRVGKGTHRALDRCQALVRRHRFVLQCDVQKFFPSLDHTILLDRLCTKVQDQKLRRLIMLILESGAEVHSDEDATAYFEGDDLFSALRARGLPIGNLTSQIWANVFMNPFDHFVMRELRAPGYVRYVDDFLVFGDDKPMLWRARAAIEMRLARLRLRFHPGAHPRPVEEGIPFLGFVVYPERRRLKRRKGIHYRTSLRSKLIAYQRGDIPYDAVAHSIEGWVNYVRYGNTVGLRKAIFREIGPGSPVS